MISHIKDAKSPSQAWNVLAILFNQAIDNEAVAIREAARKRSQKAICYVMSIEAYFGGVKELCFQCEQLG